MKACSGLHRIRAWAWDPECAGVAGISDATVLIVGSSSCSCKHELLWVPSLTHDLQPTASAIL